MMTHLINAMIILGKYKTISSVLLQRSDLSNKGLIANMMMLLLGQACDIEKYLLVPPIFQINLRYNGVIVWNNILSSSVPVDVSQAVFSKQLKCAIINGTLWKSTCLEYIYDIDH